MESGEEWMSWGKQGLFKEDDVGVASLSESPSFVVEVISKFFLSEATSS